MGRSGASINRPELKRALKRLKRRDVLVRGVYPFMPVVAVSLKNPCNQNNLQNALYDMLRRDFDQSQVLEISGISQSYAQRTVTPSTNG